MNCRARSLIRGIGAAILMACFIITAGYAEQPPPVKPDADEKCPVCGMFVAKYPDWVAEIIFNDGSVVFFDGCKDFFKYYFNLDEYAPGKARQDIDALYVTEYYSLEFMDAHTALYVVGSNVYGPMGNELIPFVDLESAREFLKDHEGKAIYTFDEITPGVIGRLD